MPVTRPLPSKEPIFIIFMKEEMLRHLFLLFCRKDFPAKLLYVIVKS
jgi:hypothetical protein